jgi:hypothetical protein
MTFDRVLNAPRSPKRITGGPRMPSSAVQTFTEPDEYAAAIGGTRAEMTVIGLGHFIATPGRFAAAYRNAFGEAPSTILRRSPGSGVFGAVFAHSAWSAEKPGV